MLLAYTVRNMLVRNIVRNSPRYVRNICTEQPVWGGQLRDRLCPDLGGDFGADLGAHFKTDFGAGFWGQYHMPSQDDLGRGPACSGSALAHVCSGSGSALVHACSGSGSAPEEAAPSS